ncbi:hypothetical protein [Bergeyella zoohelcum]|uniref:Uncharacterized protein n=1 Tax=Bergeyella zoohelcum ATCC 43767 TaxID=883096 RepID=K1LCD6_9FLAO|nr:hypothetical protein [Bergeyella zoohelcum]EKB54235.1 hypothetical protein HMPREF9699_02047 [Bergeyella zoohelcum ATCC 43767]SUV49878.1 Uncharacterised protein [Bergeyella zoohelcum]
MNKTTIKISVLAFLGFMTYGYAQQQQQDPHRGKVGVNTIEPSATMDIRPSTANAQKEATTNEGIIAPKLSKTRIANIATPVEGTLVYATDDATSLISAYTGNDPKVAKITEKGYYFYNGTEWVKAGSDATDQLWKFVKEFTTSYSFPPTNTAKVTEYGLVPSLKEGEYVAKIHVFDSQTADDYSGILDLSTVDKTTKVPASRTRIGAAGMELFNHRSDQTHMGYIDMGKTDDVDYSIRIIGQDLLANTDSNDDIHNKRLTISSVDAVNGNTFFFHLDGAQTRFSNNNVNYLFDDNGFFLQSKKAVSSNDINSYTYFNIAKTTGVNSTGNNSKMTLSLNRFFNSNGSWAGTTERLQRIVNATKMGFIDFGIHGAENSSSYNGLGFGFNETLHAVIRENGNVGVGTTTPTEKLDVAGNIKSSSLASNAGNRHVYADANGVLKIGTNDVTTLASLWTEDVTNNSIKLAVNSDGSTRSNAVSILDDGKVHASSFMGTNGATIFPDYVFQKYYTGTSSIKADYNFKSLSQVEDFVKANGHLPGYKSAATIKAQGYVDLMETQLTNVEKIEELYLHSIEQDKVNKQQAEALRAKDAEIADLKQRLERLEKLIQ